METNVHYTIVGLFVITLIAAITLAIIWLTSGFSLESYRYYLSYMPESVNGLNLDAPVEFNGVNVGSVKRVEISSHNPQLVKLLLKIKSSTPITEGTVATLASRGFTGVPYVALKDTGSDLRPLHQEANKPYPVIKTMPSLLTRLDSIMAQLSVNFKQISDTFASVFDPENKKNIKETLQNMRSVTNNMAANNEKFNLLLQNSIHATERFAPVLKTIETQTLPTMYQMLSNLEEMSRSLADTAQEIKQNPSVLIRGAERHDLGPGERR